MTLSAPGGDAADVGADVGAKRTRPAWVRPVVIVVILLVCTWVAWEFIGAIDWSAVWEALTHLTWWQVPVLLLFVVARNWLNAVPLVLFIPGLSAFKALINDLTAAMMAVVAPPPADMVIRVGMFRSWGIDASWGLVGATMTTITFYINRFTAPVVGLIVYAVLNRGTQREWWVLGSLLIALAILLVLTLVVRSERLAVRIGAAAGRLAQRVRPQVEPEVWAEATTGFQSHVAERYRRGLPWSLVALVIMVLADATVLLLSLRFVGVTAEQVPAHEVIIAFFLAYPLTLPPLMGLGILDVVLLGVFVELGGQAIEPEVIAALTVWRAMTILGPMLLGIGASAWWRRSVAGRSSSGRSSSGESEPAD